MLNQNLVNQIIADNLYLTNDAIWRFIGLTLKPNKTQKDIATLEMLEAAFHVEDLRKQGKV